MDSDKSSKSSRSKRGNMEGSEPRLRKDGLWQANFVAGYKPSGQTVRKSVYAKTKAECTRKLSAAIREIHAGEATVGAKPRLIEWLDFWLAKIAPATAKSQQTRRGYANKIDSHVRPHRLAGKRLDKLTAMDFETIYSSMRENGLSETSVAGLHAVLRRALNMAVKRGILGKNPMARLDAPTPDAFEPQVYSTDEVRRIIAAAQNRDDEARWLLNLMLGPRQGEALGLTWSDIDFEKDKIRIERELYALPWKHGCNVEDPRSPTCGLRFGTHCPERHGGGYFVGPPKSSAGVRRVTMPKPLRSALLELSETQQTLRAFEPWTVWKDQNGVERDLVFCRPGGLPIYTKADWKAWRALLAEAKVPAGRIHDGRHTAATTMLLLGVPERVVMEILGWSQISMLQRYQHVLDEMHKDVADKLTDHWTPPPPSKSNVISLQDRIKQRGNFGA